jgi:hypothetical protein
VKRSPCARNATNHRRLTSTEKPFSRTEMQKKKKKKKKKLKKTGSRRNTNKSAHNEKKKSKQNKKAQHGKFCACMIKDR